jgi:hypothetical protein
MFAETNSQSEPPVVEPRSPWNRGKFIGQNHRLSFGRCGQSAFVFS